MFQPVRLFSIFICYSTLCCIYDTHFIQTLRNPNTTPGSQTAALYSGIHNFVFNEILVTVFEMAEKLRREPAVEEWRSLVINTIRFISVKNWTPQNLCEVIFPRFFFKYANLFDEARAGFILT